MYQNLHKWTHRSEARRNRPGGLSSSLPSERLHEILGSISRATSQRVLVGASYQLDHVALRPGPPKHVSVPSLAASVSPTTGCATRQNGVSPQGSVCSALMSML
jgi:hypothetical protein